jgi:hypothetical protein
LSIQDKVGACLENFNLPQSKSMNKPLLLSLALCGCATTEKPPPTEPTALHPVTATQSQPAAALTPPGSAPVAPCQVSISPLLGPETSKKAACQAASFRYANCDKIKTVVSAKASADFEVIELAKSPGSGEKNQQFLIYLKTKAGWFARRVGTDGDVWVEEFSFDGNPPTAGIQRDYYTPPDWIKAMELLPSKGEEVVLWYSNPDGGFRSEIPEGHQLDVCGIGESGAPSCTGWLFLTTPSRTPTTKIEDLFSKIGEVYQLSGDSLRWCAVSFR